MEKLQVAVVLTIDEINQVLRHLSECPLKDVIDVFTKIKSAGDQAVAGAKARMESQAQMGPQE